MAILDSGVGGSGPREIGVNFPFALTIQHPPKDLKGMFQLTREFDLYEMGADLSDREGLVKENILVDVLECTPTMTVVKVTPAETMSYDLIARHTQLMFDQLNKRILGGKGKVVRLTWEIDKTGVASDLRGMLRKVV